MLLLFLLMLSLSRAEHETLCTSNACFTLHMDQVSFKKARSNCEHNGGYLMTIRDREEEDVLRSLLSQVQRQERPLKIRIGLKLQRESCVLSDTALRGFKWVSGEEDSQYSNWEKDPLYTCHERCVSVIYNPTGHNHMKWTAGSCKSDAVYICKFYFNGMCKALTLLGLGQISYTAPFSQEPQRQQMKSLPVGTYANVLCSDQESRYSVCTNTHQNIYSWTDPGPFCDTNRECSTKNGGCEHVCRQSSDGVICSCNDGYELDEDGFSCRLKNLCEADTCQYECVVEERGFTCHCPQGFELDSNLRTCSDIDECQSRVCGEHLCVNTEGSYVCKCNEGYEMVDGECRDEDECLNSKCQHTCLNGIGSFSCHCHKGFLLSEDGHFCEDIDECVSSTCEFECVNTPGSFLCACPNGFRVDSDGEACVPDVAFSASPSESPTVKETEENFTESLSGTVELQHESPHTDAPLQDFNNTHDDGQIDTSLATSFSKSFSSRVLICVLGSVIPLVLLVTITLGILIYRFSQVKKETKKNATTDGYCWVSSGLDPRLEKLYESIPTDDL